MTKILAWCDSPQAPTGFGRSALHVLTALHEAGFEIVQLAVNQDPAQLQAMPWKTYVPKDLQGDAHGVSMLPHIVEAERPDMLWATFDPEVPWKYAVPGTQTTAIDYLLQLRESNPGFKAMGWFPVDGGPLSDFELAMLGMGPQMDFTSTMASHVHDLIEWTLKLKGHAPNRGEIEKRLHVIPHGIDTSTYRPATGPEEKAEARRLLGLPEDRFLIVQVERNQQRKQNYLGLAVMEDILRKAPDHRGRVMLYQHMLPDEENDGCRLGFNLPELAWRYGLRPGEDVLWPHNFVKTEAMPLVYRAADVFLSTSTGEGFQYPAWEALATGVPIVVPKDSARKAWFGSAPGATLYAVDDHALVMRGGYNRRMSMPRPTSAAKAILRMIRGHDKTGSGKRSAMVKWIERTASVKDVQARWVEVAKHLEAQLIHDRREMQVVTEDMMGDDVCTVAMGHSPGIGDAILAAPAVRALREKLNADGKKLHFRIPAEHLAVVRMLDCADAYDLHRGARNGELAIDYLYRNGHQQDWGNPRVHRTEVIARYLGIENKELRPIFATIPEPIREQVRSQFLEAFGVDPTSCVGIALESANPHRAFPKNYILQLIDAVLGMGLTPVLLGKTPLGVARVGVVDMTGKTDLVFATAIIEQLGGIVTTDSATLHLAGIVGTPMVACFTLFDPASRLRYYAGPKEAVTAQGIVADEEFPAGPFPKAQPGEWAATIKPSDIAAALRRLLGVEQSAAPLVLMPQDGMQIRGDR